ncbi:MAG: AsnC family transcriptional regulator [Nanoarchaeales archaeon]|nr:AsnC family transcriptional regulator [Nanoarchaeales archaeon]
MNIDLLDKKILFLLEQNSKLPVSTLSKQVHASREVVNYRIKKLEEKNIIKSYISRIDQSLFCLGAASLNLTINKSNQIRYLEILDFLKNYPNINWIGELCGTQDLSVTILYQNSFKLSEIIENITLFIDKDLISYSVHLYVDEIKFSRIGILELENYDIKLTRGTKFENQKKIKLDDKDLIILKELSQNSKITNIELSKKIDSKEDMVRIRIKNLEKNCVILGYTIVINPYVFGFEGYYINLNIENLTYKNYDLIKSYINSNPFIFYSVKIVGEYNLLIVVYTKNRLDFNEILINLRSFFGTSLKKYEVQMLLNEHKEVFISKEIIN